MGHNQVNVTNQVKVTHRSVYKHIDQIRHRSKFEFTERRNENDPIDPIHADKVIALQKSLELSPEPRSQLHFLIVSETTIASTPLQPIVNEQMQISLWSK